MPGSRCGVFCLGCAIFSLFLQGIERDDVVGEFGCHAVGIVLIPGGLVPSTIYSIDDGS